MYNLTNFFSLQYTSLVIRKPFDCHLLLNIAEEEEVWNDSEI